MGVCVGGGGGDTVLVRLSFKVTVVEFELLIS